MEVHLFMLYLCNYNDVQVKIVMGQGLMDIQFYQGIMFQWVMGKGLMELVCLW